jgi:hypothetical protein
MIGKRDDRDGVRDRNRHRRSTGRSVTEASSIFASAALPGSVRVRRTLEFGVTIVMDSQEY